MFQTASFSRPCWGEAQGASVWSALWEPGRAPGRLGLCRVLNSPSCSHRVSRSVSVRLSPASAGFPLLGLTQAHCDSWCLLIFPVWRIPSTTERDFLCDLNSLTDRSKKVVDFQSFFLGRFVATTYKFLTCWTGNQISPPNLFLLVSL